jgi:hypothetical protein
VPNLYVVDGSAAADGPTADAGGGTDGSDAGVEAAADATDEGTTDDGSADGSVESCAPVTCPGCPPTPDVGMCCPNTNVLCEGANCAVDCNSSQCTSCNGNRVCCSKPPAAPQCKPNCH